MIENFHIVQKSRIRETILGRNLDQVVFGSQSKATKMALETDNVIENLFNLIFFEIIFRSNGVSATSYYGRAMWVGFGRPELHSIGSTEKYNVALHNFQYSFVTSANMSIQLEAYGKVLFYCESGSRKAGNYHQQNLNYW